MSFTEEMAKEMFRDAGVKDEILRDLPPDASLIDAGVDSLDFANVLLAIEERFGVKIPDEDALEIDSLRKLAGYVAARLR